MFQYLVILVVLITGIQGQFPVPGKCPDVTVVKNFDLNKCLGKWYEQAKYPNKFQLEGRCFFTQFTKLANGTVKVHNSEIVEKSGKERTMDGTARMADGSNEGKILFNMTIDGVNYEGINWILRTDYDSYSIVWACEEKEIKQIPTSMRYVWLLTRARFPPEDIITKMHEILDKANISRESLKISSQHNCTEKL